MTVRELIEELGKAGVLDCRVMVWNGSIEEWDYGGFKVDVKNRELRIF